VQHVRSVSTFWAEEKEREVEEVGVFSGIHELVYAYKMSTYISQPSWLNWLARLPLDL